MASQRRKGRRWNARINIGQHRATPDEPHELETLDSASMQQWEVHGQAVRESYHALHYELESQRATRHAELCAALREAPSCKVDLNGWCRLVNFKFSKVALSPAGSLFWTGGRFNFGRGIDPSRFHPFPALYLAADFQTAYCEYHQLQPSNAVNGLTAHELDLDKPGSWVTLGLKGRVNNAFDLTKPSNVGGFCKEISRFTLSSRVRDLEQRAGIKASRLIKEPRNLVRSLVTENWRQKAAHFDLPSNSQVFAKLVIDAGFEAILYRSAMTSKKCLAVFTRQLVGSDTVIGLHEDHPSDVQYSEINASNCLDF